MEHVAYLRDQATRYRELAQTSRDDLTKQELTELAEVCEQVAANIEDRASGG